MTKSICIVFCFLSVQFFAQIAKIGDNGAYELSDEGASYFARLSLSCVKTTTPHTRYDDMLSQKDVKKVWPAFYGCYDWHSAVHNHWALVKLLKFYPNIPEASEIRSYLDSTFTPEKMLLEKEYFGLNAATYSFEFPYGQCWLLKLADELATWENDVDAKRWLKNLTPLHTLFARIAYQYWSNTNTIKISGSHDSPALGISFALDYATTFSDNKLKKVLLNRAKMAYGQLKNVSLSSEPKSFDFMSGYLLVVDLMRKVYDSDAYANWLRAYAPGLFNKEQVAFDLQIKSTSDHSGMEAHWDGFHLNRIWCLNGALSSLPQGALDDEVKVLWHQHMNAMWDYAQESIGKGNYDVDHWLSSFSVFALMGYQK